MFLNNILPYDKLFNALWGAKKNWNWYLRISVVSVTSLLLSGNTGGVFGIDNATGLIFIARDLDLTSVGFYTLTVRVTDSGFPPLMATASVRISLILSDFSNPKFSQKEYQAEVKRELADWEDERIGERCRMGGVGGGGVDAIKRGWKMVGRDGW